MTGKKDEFPSGNVILAAHDVRAAHSLINRLSELVSGETPNPPTTKRRHDLACEIVESRRSRAALFPDEVFGEPAWDILLQLYCAAGRGEAVTVYVLGRLISAPWSTIERWVNHLIERGLVEHKDEAGKVDFEVRLSENGSSRLDAYFRMLLEHHFRV